MATDVVDVTGWPVVTVVLDGEVDADAARAATEELDELLRRRERLGLVFDYRHAEPDVQQLVSGWMAARVEVLERLVAGAATVVAPDSVERVQSMIETGAFSLPFPSWAAATVEECEAWVRGCLPPG